tara:strand:+ start:283 stop:456 length:174 start_codon:yes stop_codon:yes gene_type:complete
MILISPRVLNVLLLQSAAKASNFLKLSGETKGIIPSSIKTIAIAKIIKSKVIIIFCL